jgi:hypothetical protein
MVLFLPPSLQPTMLLAIPLLLLPGTNLLASVTATPQTITRKLTQAWSGGETDGNSFGFSCSGDGSLVVFVSHATNLVPLDTNGVPDVFVLDVATLSVERVSVSTAGVQANQLCIAADISQDGRYVVFSTLASNLDPRDTDGFMDVYRRDRSTGITEVISLDPSGLTPIAAGGPKISSDGSRVAMITGTPLDPQDLNALPDVYVKNLATGTYTLASRSSLGFAGDAQADFATISGDGAHVVFQSAATNLVPGDANGFKDVFHHDLSTGLTTRISVGPGGQEANAACEYPSIARNASVVSFSSRATNLVAGPSSPGMQALAHDLASGINRYASVRSNGTFGWGENFSSVVSADGRMVSFMSGVLDIGPGAGTGYCVALHDLVSRITTVGSLNDQGNGAVGAASPFAFSDDARRIYFITEAANLGGGSSNGHYDLYVHDRRSNGPLLSIANLVGGQTATLQVTGATPGGALSIGYSLAGQGLIPTGFGFIHLAPPISMVSVVANGSGQVSRPIFIPSGLRGREPWVQGVDLQSGYPTTVFRAVVQ